MGDGDFKLIARIGPKVRKERFGSLDEALAALEQEMRGVGSAPARSVLGRDYEPVAQVAGRFEVVGRDGARGGIDVRGDGSSEAFRGRVRKRLVEREAGESAVDALRRVLLGCVVLVMLACASAASAASLVVDAGADRRPISDDIYGMNFADPALAAQIGLPVNRFGGNTTDSYNWQTGFWNTGHDYFFENIASCYDDAHGYCGDVTTRSARKHLEQLDADRARGTKTLLTVPMMGWVAKAGSSYGHPLTCAFPASRYPVQQQFDPYDAGCGNGRDAAGNPLTATKADAGQAIDPASNASAWLADLASRDRSPAFVGLGNEPMLWNSTHRHWHPEPATFDELGTTSAAVASAVKAAQPSAQTLGPSEWGWTNYFCSAYDVTSDGCSASDRDRAAHGGKELMAWYLERMKAASDQAGKRLLDFFALHYYTQGGAQTPDVTRSLWDPTYTDPSWIGDEIELLPRMRRWIAANYPRTKLALTEYDLTIQSEGNPVLQTIIQADTLGIFAREGVDLATRWAPPTAGELEADAWRIFRNYDGAGGRFGSTWVRSPSSDQAAVAVYGAERADGALTVLAINKSAAPQAADVRLDGFAAAGPAKTWRWAGPGGIARAADQSLSASGGFSTLLPSRSMTLYVVPGRADPGEDPVVGPDLPGVPGLPLPPADRSGAGATPVTVAGRPAPAAARRCVVPRLRGLTTRRARRALGAAGCRAVTVKRRGVRARSRRGRVIAQSPKPGARVLPGRRVTVVVGRAPAKRKRPR